MAKAKKSKDDEAKTICEHAFVGHQDGVTCEKCGLTLTHEQFVSKMGS